MNQKMASDEPNVCSVESGFDTNMTSSEPKYDRNAASAEPRYSTSSVTILNNVGNSVRLRVPTRRLSLPSRSRLGAMQSDSFEMNNNKRKHLWLLSEYSSLSIRRGRCSRLPISVENLRLLLLSLMLLLYTSIGSAILVAFEGSYDGTSGRYEKLESFLRRYPSVNRRDAEALMFSDVDGREYRRSGNWTFDVAFRFIGSTLSTVGYGTVTPDTTTGRLLLTCYAFFGCSGCILFFNLFLERIVTLFANVLRKCHEKAVTKTRDGKERTPSIKLWNSDVSDSETIYSDDDWRPSGFLVFICIMLFTMAFTFLCSTLYHLVEKWTYTDAYYFCFVTFATIGFGDYVPRLSNAESWKVAYMLINFFILIIGCSLLYSLFNITSLLIRQMLNFFIKFLNNHAKRKVARSASITPNFGSTKVRRLLSRRIRKRQRYGSADSVLSLKDFLALNHSSLLKIQRQLLAMSEPRRDSDQVDEDFRLSRIGPLAYLNQKFENSRDA